MKICLHYYLFTKIETKILLFPPTMQPGTFNQKSILTQRNTTRFFLRKFKDLPFKNNHDHVTEQLDQDVKQFFCSFDHKANLGFVQYKSNFVRLRYSKC